VHDVSPPSAAGAAKGAKTHQLQDEYVLFCVTWSLVGGLGVIGSTLSPIQLTTRPVASRLSAAGRGYHQVIVDHYESPRNVGSFDKNDPTVGTGLVGAPAEM